jgi:dienelactone hydrolase
MRGVQIGALALVGLIAGAASAVELTPVRGTATFTPTAAESSVPERFRLTPGEFAWQADPLGADSSTVEVWNVTFPSPVVTPHEANNTVHCEYFQPKRAGKRPAVIVLHILGGDFPLSRLFCNRLAQQGVAALFVKMPYYGPRRGAGIARRMISVNPDETVEGMTQAVLDIRRAVAWLGERDEVDDGQIGVFGISLGGITGALAATAEPMLQNVCLLLAGGDIGRVALDAVKLKAGSGELPKDLGDKETLIKKLALIDPVTYAANARGRRILLLNAKDDEVIPRACTEALYKGLGEPEIVWYSGGHYSVIRHLFGALDRVANFFAAVEGVSVAKEIYPLGKVDPWKNALMIPANRPLGKAGRFTEPTPMDLSVAWDQDNLCCRCTWPMTNVDAATPISQEVRLYLRAGKETKILTRDIRDNASVTSKAPLQIANIQIPWKELGMKPAAGQELQILAVIQSGEGDDAIIHTTGELPKQPVEQSVSRWPKYKLRAEQR